jgi:VanZ family protein
MALAIAMRARNSAGMDKVRRIAKPLFWAASLFAYVAAIMPANEAPKIAQSDKIEHMIAFCTLAFLGRLAFRATPAVKLALWLALFGAVIEFTQMIPALHRDGNVADWVADCAAIVMGLLIGTPLVRLDARRR